jgi:DNA repair protein RecN (Recombination protein N)
MVRAGSGQAVLEGRWKLDSHNAALAKADGAGALVDEGELLLVRTVGSDSRSKAAVGGRAAPVGLLSELAEHLVVVHGQSDQIRLKSPIAQRVALDRFAGIKHQELLEVYIDLYNSWRNAKQQLEELVQSDANRASEIAELSENLAFLEKLAIQANEDIELAESAKRISHTEDLKLLVGLAHEALLTDSFDGQDAIGLVGKARKSLESASIHDSKLVEFTAKLNEVSENLNEVSAFLSSYLSAIESDSAESLDEIQSRRSEINSALRKFGPTIEDLHAYEKSAHQRLFNLDNLTEQLEDLSARVSELEAKAFSAAKEISVSRTSAALQLGERVSLELSALAMSGSKLQVEIESTQNLTANGLDNVSFLLESYVGAEPRPIGKGASGGELSRIMLAIEVILAESGSAPTFIFDEVDAGVGGAAAIEVGRRLAKLSKNAQVIVVTHLAQVAAFADQHLAIVKSSEAMFTASDVRVLEGNDRAEELARMLSGLSDSETARSHALELLALSQNI